MMTEQQTEEQKAAEYEVHEMALQFPAQTPEETAQLRENMIQRVHQGLAPLESPILLVGGKIADGRHRYQIWQKLAAEGACDGYFANNLPTVEESSANGQDGEAVALLRINARNLHHRILSAEQKAAIFLIQEEKYPSLKLLVEKIQTENQERMKAGKSLDDKSQGTNTNEKLGELAGNVSASTIKNVKSVQKHAPQYLADVASGKMSAKTAMKKSAETQQADTQKSEQLKATSPKSPKRKSPIDLGPKKNGNLAGQTVVGVGDSGQLAQVREFLGDELIKHEVHKEDEGTFFSFDGTAVKQKNTLTFLANLIAASGPFKLTILLDAVPKASPANSGTGGGNRQHELQGSSVSS